MEKLPKLQKLSALYDGGSCLEELSDLEKLPKSIKLSALYQDDFEMPIFLPILQSGIDLSDILHVNHGKFQTMHGFCNDSVRILHGSKIDMEPLSDRQETI